MDRSAVCDLRDAKKGRLEIRRRPGQSPALAHGHHFKITLHHRESQSIEWDPSASVSTGMSMTLLEKADRLHPWTPPDLGSEHQIRSTAHGTPRPGGSTGLADGHDRRAPGDQA